MLRGSGVEFGPGSSPFPAPIECDVSYADFLPMGDLERRKYPSQVNDFAELSHIMSLDEMDLPAASLDFVIACQVIEHTHSPLRVFERVYRTLRPGGCLLLVVPDTLLTFDAPREATSLEYLREDYANWSPEKDTLR